MKTKRVTLLYLALCTIALVGVAAAGSLSGTFLTQPPMNDLVGGVSAGCVLAGAGLGLGLLVGAAVTGGVVLALAGAYAPIIGAGFCSATGL